VRGATLRSEVAQRQIHKKHSIEQSIKKYMENIIAFIKNFHASQLGLGLGDFLLILLAIIVGLSLIHWLVSRASRGAARTFREVVKGAFMIFGTLIVLFILLNAILTGNYGIVFIGLLLIASSKIDHWFALYDHFMNKINGGK
jgi:hypothetical protein